MKLSLFANNMIIYVENLKNQWEKLFLELISNYSKVAEYKLIHFPIYQE